MKNLVSMILLVAIIAPMFVGCKVDSKEIYPARSVNLIIPFDAGGSTDLWNRAMATSLEKYMGQKVNSSNMTGGTAGSLGAAYVWSEVHDGYTLLGTSETSLIIPAMTGIKQTSKDWEYFIAGGSPGLLLANKAVGVQTFADVIVVASGKPDELKIASASDGLWLILANLFRSYGNVPLGVVSYQGSQSAISACVSGETAFVIASAGDAAVFVNSGDLVPITTIQTTDYDMPGFGEIEAVTKHIPILEKKLPLNQFVGFRVPMDTPEDVKAKLKDSFKLAMESQEMKDFALSQYAVIVSLTGKEASEFCGKVESLMSWILDDLQLTKYNPADFGIAKP